MKNLELIKARMIRGLTQADMAKILNITRTAYRFKEDGESGFSTDQIVLLVHELNLSFDEMNAIFFHGKLPYGHFALP